MELIDLLNSVIISNDLTQMVNFPTLIPDSDFHSHALLDLFFSSDASTCSTMVFPSLGNSGLVFVLVFHWLCAKLKRECHISSHSLWLFSCWLGLLSWSFDVPRVDIFKLGASAAASEFWEWVQVRVDVYVPHRKYQVKPHSSPWFSAACTAVMCSWSCQTCIC